MDNVANLEKFEKYYRNCRKQTMDGISGLADKEITFYVFVSLCSLHNLLLRHKIT